MKQERSSSEPSVDCQIISLMSNNMAPVRKGAAVGEASNEYYEKLADLIIALVETRGRGAKASIAICLRKGDLYAAARLATDLISDRKASEASSDGAH